MVGNEQFVEINASIKILFGLGDSDKGLVGGEILFAESVAHWSPLAEFICEGSVQPYRPESDHICLRNYIRCVRRSSKHRR